MPRAPRGKRVIDSSTGSFVVVNRAQRGQPDPFFDRSRNVWVAVAKGRRQNGTTDRPDAPRLRRLATDTSLPSWRQGSSHRSPAASTPIPA